MSNIDDQILDNGGDNSMPLGDVSQFLEEVQLKSDTETQEEKKQGQFKGFQPKGRAAVISDQVKAVAAEATKGLDTDNEVTAQRIAEMERNLKALMEGKDGAKLKAKSEVKASIDFSKLSEKDVWDLNIPIQAIEHGLPDYLNVELLDSNYIARWVHKTPRRLGPMLSVGWTFVEPKDLANKLILEVKPNENGQYQHDDVLLMKLSKVKYFGMLRRNLLISQARVNPKTAHQIAKQRVITDMESAGRKDYDKYSSEGKLNIYAPGFEI
jgi:hypothetical protein